ncbi:MAG: lytic transglycosylase domain-containing protein [Rhizobiales bacterium]|nr:lytic transglycosylase domain-containing protein [Hyphomicrobiales bacterium]
MSVDSILTNAASQITGAIKQAARSTGISFEYLLTAAKIESNLNPSAQASTSSAKGLYQFIEQTWLGTIKASGPANGYGNYADAISRSADGRYAVADPTMRAEIMRLRGDPAASAMMAGSFTRSNAEQLRGAIGRQPSEGELYLAHFLGPGGAAKMIGAASVQPRTNAADLFPQAAAANPSIFYDATGRPRGVGDVYGKLTGRFETARALSFAPSTRVADQSVSARLPSPGTRTVDRSDASAPPSPDTAGVTQAFAQASDLPPLPDTKPLFQSMFTDRARAAVTRTVSSLWTSDKSAAPSQPARPLDLFTDSATDTQKLFRGSV